jgi:hypothetical protein
MSFTPKRVAIETLGEDFLLRRHDYSVDVAGGFGAAQLTSDYVEVQGVRLPTKRRAHTRWP